MLTTSNITLDTDADFELTGRNKLKLIISLLLQKLPRFSSVLLRIRYRYREDYPHIAATDGVTITFGSKFFTLDQSEQMFILLHETLHNVLMHSKRLKEFVAQGCINFTLLNVCADLLINESLVGIPGIIRPKFGIFFEDLAKQGLLDRDKRDETLNLSIPELYRLLDKKHKLSQYFTELDLEANGDSKEPSDNSGNSNQSPTSKGKGKGTGTGNKKEVTEENKLTGDMLSDIKEYQSNIESQDLLNEANDNAQDRLPIDIEAELLLKEFSKLAGTENSQLLTKLLGIKPSYVDWRKVLKEYFLRAVKPQDVYLERPAKRMGEYLHRESIPFIRKLGTKPGRPQIAVALDVSGSIYYDKSLLTIFFSELEHLRRKVSCDIRLITFQCDVEADILIPLDNESLIDKVNSGSLDIKGGGGTDFRPVLKLCVEDKKIKLVLVLTDLWGDWGRKRDYNKLNIIWVLSPEHNTQKPSFGKLVTITEK
jgi:predicted metal-dependent peptidase